MKKFLRIVLIALITVSACYCSLLIYMVNEERETSHKMAKFRSDIETEKLCSFATQLTNRNDFADYIKNSGFELYKSNETAIVWKRFDVKGKRDEIVIIRPDR